MNDELGVITKCYTVTYHRTSKHPADRLWTAITDPVEVADWMGCPKATIELEPGGPYYVSFEGHPGSQEEGDHLDGIVTRIDPSRYLAYAWGTSVVEWKIEPTDDGCTYEFVHTGLADRGEGEEGLPAGWHVWFECLDAHLDGERLDQEDDRRWKELGVGYRRQLEAVIR